MQKLTSSWEPTNEALRNKLDAVKSAGLERDRLRGGYEKANVQIAQDLEGKVPMARIDELTGSPVSMKWFLRSDEATQLGLKDISKSTRAVESFIEARNRFGDLQKETDALIRPRIEQLQAVTDEMTNRYGLPRVTVRAKPAQGSYGSYADGKINIAAEVLVSEKPEDLTNTVYHELTHHEQYSLMVRRLADLHNVGSKASAQESAAITDEYLTRTARSTLDQSFLNDVLEARNGQFLTDEQAKGADDLLAVSTRRAPIEQQQYEKLTDLYRSLASKATSLSGENGLNVTQRILNSDAQSGNLSTMLSLTLPDNTPKDLPAPQVQLVRSDLESSRQALLIGIRQWQADINSWRESSYTKYLGTKIEWDAWLNGQLANAQALKAVSA